MSAVLHTDRWNVLLSLCNHTLYSYIDIFFVDQSIMTQNRCSYLCFLPICLALDGRILIARVPTDHGPRQYSLFFYSIAPQALSTPDNKRIKISKAFE